jgi:hypothetical protein
MANYNSYVLVIIIAVIAFYLGQINDSNRERENLSFLLEDAVITECDGGSCYLSVPDKDTIIVSCAEGYQCTTKMQTLEQEQEDIKMREQLSNIFNNTERVNISE